MGPRMRARGQGRSREGELRRLISQPRTLPLRPWGSTQSFFFMVSEVPIRLRRTVLLPTELRPCFLTSTFLGALATTTVDTDLRALRGRGDRGEGTVWVDRQRCGRAIRPQNQAFARPAAFGGA